MKTINIFIVLPDHNLSDLIEALEEENDVSGVSSNLEDMGITDDEEKRISQGSL